MYRGLTAAYDKIAAEFGAEGDSRGRCAFHLADTDATWGFKPDTTFDPKTRPSNPSCRIKRIPCTSAGAG
jgi:hypothetical protein